MIRKAKEEDFDEIYKLGSILHDNYSKVYDLKKLINTEYFHCYVYEDEEKIKGFISYTVVCDNVDLIDIVVDPNYRRQKIAENLMDTMIGNLKKTDNIYLEVAVDNQNAINLYQKFGFEIIHTREKYYGEKDAYVMERVMTDE